LLYLLLGVLFSELGEEKKREEREKGILRDLSSFFCGDFFLLL
jgi:hypothetical protein